jgi:hypothetical protein
VEIALTRPQQIPVAKVGRIGIKAVIAATTLYALCVLPPSIYMAHPAVRAWQRDTRNRELFFNRSLFRLRQAHQAVLSEVQAIDDSTARIASLEVALERANDNLAGYHQKLRGSQRSCNRMDTLFHRLTGNKILAMARQQVREERRYFELAGQHVRDLQQALQRSLRGAAQ